MLGLRTVFFAIALEGYVGGRVKLQGGFGFSTALTFVAAVNQLATEYSQ